MQYSHYIVGMIPTENKPEDNKIMYDQGLRKDLKTWNGALRWAQSYAKVHRNCRKGMVPVLLAFRGSMYDQSPPVRWSFL